VLTPVRRQIVVHVHALHFTSSPAPSQLRAGLRDRGVAMASVPGRTLCVPGDRTAHGRALTAPAGSMVGGQLVEVLDFVEVESHMEPLKGSLGALSAAFDHCYWLSEKIRLFS
jgi:hypothetical protein